MNERLTSRLLVRFGFARQDGNRSDRGVRGSGRHRRAGWRVFVVGTCCMQFYLERELVVVCMQLLQSRGFRAVQSR